MTSNYWVWFGCYLIVGIGAILLSVTYYDRKSGGGSYFREWRAGLIHIFKNLLPMVGIVVIWPIVVYIILAGPLKLPLPSGAPARKFQCKRKHLLQRVTIAEAEIAGKVLDPLYRVPDLPFGYLNKIWLLFVAKLTPETQLWSFTIPGQSDTAYATKSTEWSIPRGAKRGYAVVRRKKIQAEFIFEWD